jgi:hypothetical protein
MALMAQWHKLSKNIYGIWYLKWYVPLALFDEKSEAEKRNRLMLFQSVIK